MTGPWIDAAAVMEAADAEAFERALERHVSGLDVTYWKRECPGAAPLTVLGLELRDAGVPLGGSVGRGAPVVQGPAPRPDSGLSAPPVRLRRCPRGNRPGRGRARRRFPVRYGRPGTADATQPWNGGSPHLAHHRTRFSPMRLSRASLPTSAASSERV